MRQLFLAIFFIAQTIAPTNPTYKGVLVQQPYVCGAEYATRPYRVAVLGNSLAWSPPQPNFDWNQSNGMAATALQSDYPHVLCAMLAERRHQSIVLLVVQAWAIETAINTNTGWDKTYSEIINTFNPDTLVVQYSDNVVQPDPVARFPGVYNAVLDSVHPRSLVCMGGWYQIQPSLTAAIKAACDQRGGAFVPIVDIFLAPDMRGESFDSAVNHGVGSHPNNTGHFEIARRVERAIN